jgi:hypothetical protein
MSRPNSLYLALTKPLLHLRSALTKLDAQALARRSGFLRRRPRKIPMADLLLAFCALAGESVLSLERIAAVVGLVAGCSYSKQAFHQRLSQRIEHFLAAVAVELFGQLSDPLRRGGCFATFGRVLLHDSTIQSLPANLAAVFPGSSNQKCKNGAALKIQWVCDLLSGALLQLSLSSFRRNDQAAAADILSVVRKGDLILRDLGYFSLSVLTQLQELGAFFLSRLRADVRLRDPRTKKPIALLRLLQTRGRFDGWVLIGEEQRLMRLVALPLPQEVASRRRALAKANRDRRLAPSKQRLALMNWSLFITNVTSKIWKAPVVARIYRLRWRIEIIFKSWKSHLRLRELNCRSADLVRLSILLKLFYCLLTTNCFDALARVVGSARQVSLLRFSKALGHCSILISAILLQMTPEQILAHYMTNHTCYERRPDRLNFSQRLAQLTSPLT